MYGDDGSYNTPSAFCAVQILTCISTIVDLATHRSTPTPLGTQHFALLLAAWGPVIVFGQYERIVKSLRESSNKIYRTFSCYPEEIEFLAQDILIQTIGNDPLIRPLSHFRVFCLL